jgi:hypothetical protein
MDVWANVPVNLLKDPSGASTLGHERLVWSRYNPDGRANTR